MQLFGVRLEYNGDEPPDIAMKKLVEWLEKTAGEKLKIVGNTRRFPTSKISLISNAGLASVFGRVSNDFKLLLVKLKSTEFEETGWIAEIPLNSPNRQQRN